MKDHRLIVMKGAGNKPFALTYRSKLADGVAAEAGMVVHLNSSGLYELGVGALDCMPLFLWQSDDDYDVSQGAGAGDPATDLEAYVGIGPEGDMTTFVATGATELFSTEKVGAANTFVPNAYLTAATVGGDAGKLAIGTLGTHTICGIVSRNGFQTFQKKTGVCFWPWYFPASGQ
jgi:hypothetical protein